MKFPSEDVLFWNVQSMLLIMGRAKFPSQASHRTRIFACLYYAYYVLVHVREHITVYDSFNRHALQKFNANVIINLFKDHLCEHLKTDSSPYLIVPMSCP